MLDFFKKRFNEIKSREIMVEYSFKLNHLTTTQVVNFLTSEELGFKPGKLVWGGNHEKSFTANTVNWLRNQNSEIFERGITLKDVHGSDRIDIIEPMQYISPGVHYIRWTGPLDILNSNVFREIMTWPGFVVAYAVSEEDEFIQNQELNDRYISRGITPSKKRVYIDEFGNKRIDINGNPGRNRVVRNMILRSCWRMWFGASYFELIPETKILSFRDANKNMRLKDEIHFIELYEDPFLAHHPENRAIQQQFNKHIGIEEVYEQCLEESGFRF
jgi:hypothetical protein